MKQLLSKEKYWTVLYLIFLLLCACIDKIDLGVKEGEKRLVVDGQITDEEGFHYVKLSYTSGYGSDLNSPLSGATVSILDDIGNSFPLTEAYLDTVKQILNKGTYQTKKIKGQPGRKYTLLIETNGQKYSSNAELLVEAPTIENIYYERKVKTILNEDKSEISVPGYDFFIDVQDLERKENYYRWQYQSVYEVVTQPADYVEYDGSGNPIPMPKDSSASCWITENDFSFNVNDDQYSSGSLKNQRIVFVPFEKYLQIKYRLEVRQLSISKNVYQFYKDVNKLISNTGTIFDPIPSKIKGNIYNIKNKDEIVLGIFSAAGVSRKTIFVDRKEMNEIIPPFIFPDDCKVLKNSTSRRPKDW
jgi:hypothetical protein